MLIAVQMLFGDGLALSVCFADTSPRGRALKVRENVISITKKSPRHHAEVPGGLFVQSGGMRKLSALGVG